MGATIASIGNMLSGATDEAVKNKNQQTKELLDNMTELVKTKVEVWRNFVLDSAKNPKRISVERTLMEKLEVRASADFNTEKSEGDKKGNLFKGIKDCAASFTDGKYVDGVANGLESIISGVIGSASGSASEESNYMVIVGDNGALLRIDYYCYFRKVMAAQLFSSQMQELIGVGYIISSVSYKDVDSFTIKAVVELCCSHLKPEDKKALESEISKAVEEAKKTDNPKPIVLFS
jgi:hypothetical protein